MMKPPSKRYLGTCGETLAKDYLRQKGYLILHSNYHIRCGEIDLIARDRETLVFIEVKYRRSSKFGHPLESVTYRKQQRILRAAQFFLVQYPYTGPLRFDVLGITDIRGHEIQYEYILNAISV